MALNPGILRSAGFDPREILGPGDGEAPDPYNPGRDVGVSRVGPGDRPSSALDVVAPRYDTTRVSTSDVQDAIRQLGEARKRRARLESDAAAEEVNSRRAAAVASALGQDLTQAITGRRTRGNTQQKIADLLNARSRASQARAGAEGTASEADAQMAQQLANVERQAAQSQIKRRNQQADALSDAYGQRAKALRDERAAEDRASEDMEMQAAKAKARQEQNAAENKYSLGQIAARGEQRRLTDANQAKLDSQLAQQEARLGNEGGGAEGAVGVEAPDRFDPANALYNLSSELQSAVDTYDKGDTQPWWPGEGTLPEARTQLEALRKAAAKQTDMLLSKAQSKSYKQYFQDNPQKLKDIQRINRLTTNEDSDMTADAMKKVLDVMQNSPAFKRHSYEERGRQIAKSNGIEGDRGRFFETAFRRNREQNFDEETAARRAREEVQAASGGRSVERSTRQEGPQTAAPESRQEQGGSADDARLPYEQVKSLMSQRGIEISEEQYNRYSLNQLRAAKLTKQTAPQRQDGAFSQ